ncbi:MAG: flippase [Euryarchaeota archaeon]|nr:flippase [Euryarchaeota archaeon]
MKELLEGGLVLSASNLLVRLASYVYRVLMGRLLSPYEFGLLNLALPIQYMAVLLSSSGIAPAIAKFVAEAGARGDDATRDRLVSSALTYYGLLAALAAVALYVLSGPISLYAFRDPNLEPSLRLAALSLPFGVLVAVYTGTFQGLKRPWRMGGTLLLEQLLRIAFATALVYQGHKALDSILGSTLGFVATLPLAYLLARGLGVKHRAPSWGEFRRVLVFSLPISATALAAFLLAYVDLFFLGLYRGMEEVGIYSAASPTSRILLAFSTALSAVLLPRLSELRSRGTQGEVRAEYTYSLKISILVLVPATLASILLSREIITLLFGPAYGPAARPFEILAVGTAFMGIFTINSGALQGLGMPSLPMRLLLSTALLDVILNALLVPGYGLEGAAAASTLSFAYAGVASTWLLRRVL